MIKIVINMNWSEVFVYKQNTSLVVVGVDLGGWRIKSVVACGVKERGPQKLETMNGQITWDGNVHCCERGWPLFFGAHPILLLLNI